MPFIAAKDGAQLYWREWGAGAPILFLNSLGCGHGMWDYQMAAFADEGFRCIGFDRRGHGRSDQPANGYDFDTFADDVAALVDHLDLSGLTLIAHSMAGGEAVRYLTRHGSQRVARLVLLAPTTPMLLKTDDNPNGLPREAFEALWAQWRRDYPKWIADNVAPFFIPETSPAMMRWGANLLQTSLPITLACSRAMVEADFRAEMRRHRRSNPYHPRRPRPINAGRTHRQAFGRAHSQLPARRLSGRAARPHVHPHGSAQRRPAAVHARALAGPAAPSAWRRRARRAFDPPRSPLSVAPPCNAVVRSHSVPDRVSRPVRRSHGATE